MRRIISLILIFGFTNVIFAAPYRIDLQKNENNLVVRYSDISATLSANSEINFGDWATGTWDGNNFSLTSNGEILEDLDIRANTALTFDSFISLGKCKVRALLVEVLNEAFLPDFSVELNSGENNILKITGRLMTKSCKVLGSAKVYGTLDILDGGTFFLEGYSDNNLTISGGTLSSSGAFNVDTSKSPNAKIINDGTITSPSEKIFITSDFINGRSGQVVGGSAKFLLSGKLQNSGLLGFEQLSVGPCSRILAGRAYLNFIQTGVCDAARVNLSCNIESSGRTLIDQLTFTASGAVFRVTGGQTEINVLSGKISTLRSEDEGRISIEEMRGGAEFIESPGGNITIREEFVSDDKVNFSVKEAGSIDVTKVTASQSFIHSTDNASVFFKEFNGQALIAANSEAKVRIQNADQLTVIGTGEANIVVEASHIKNGYFLDNTKSILSGDECDFIFNNGISEQGDSHTDRVENEGLINYNGDTFIRNLSNANVVVFADGYHEIARYEGRTGDALLKAKGEEEDAEDVSLAANINLKDGCSNVFIDQALGLGTFEASQHRYKSLAIPFFLKGNVDISMDHMPLPNEIPEHDGDLRIFVDMNEDFINEEEINYGDVFFEMDMHGYKWENKSIFFAGGLDLYNVSQFGNYDAWLGLERMLNVSANNIFNCSTPEERENGRLVDDWSNWRARLKYYCPATYYFANRKNGISVDCGSIVLKSEGDIINKFSKIHAGGTFEASALGNFDNIVGSITAFGGDESSISAQNINNRCLEACSRQGSAHASGRCGWGMGRHTWHAYSSTYELITQSPGAKIMVSGDLTLHGHAENFGSTILSGGLFRGDINSKSLFENIAKHGARGAVITGENVEYSNASICIHLDNIS